MAVFTIKLNEYFLDTFINVFGDLTNQEDNDKVKDIDEIDVLPESKDNIRN